jgi:hypothetical protein
MQDHTMPRLRIAVATLIMALLLPIHAHAASEEPSAWEGVKESWSNAGRGIRKSLDKAEKPFSIGFDAIILRPLGLVSVVIGTAVMVPMAIIASPNTIDMGVEAYDEPMEIFFRTPVNYVFKRPLGEL